MDFETILFDRLEIIKTTNQKYNLENNAYLSFSGGKDSTIVHYLLDIALPNNQIPRVFIDTGIEYNDIRNFVLKLAETDKRFIILKPTKPIKQTLEKVGYPFKSKEHSCKLNLYQKGSRSPCVMRYAKGGKEFACPTILLYQFTNDFKLRVSHECCNELKKKPIRKWENQNHRKIVITGMRHNEGGQRANLKGCILTDKNGNLKKFHPLLVVDDKWENWFIETKKIDICKLYKPPYNFTRTGCKGCPFNISLQDDLETMERYLPNERKQCEIIWKPVYDEYRRLEYRLKKVEKIKLF